MNLKWLIVAILLIAVTASGCGDKDTTTYETEDGEKVEVTTTGNQDDWCPVGTSMKSYSPTGEEVSMVYTGSEVIDGVKMCKAEFNSNNPSDDVSKMVYMWSENSEVVSWITYDANGTVLSKWETKDGKTTIVGEDGQTTVIESGK